MCLDRYQVAHICEQLSNGCGRHILTKLKRILGWRHTVELPTTLTLFNFHNYIIVFDLGYLKDDID